MKKEPNKPAAGKAGFASWLAVEHHRPACLSRPVRRIVNVYAMPSRAQRKPIVYLVVILPIVVGGGLCLVLGLLQAYARLKGVARTGVPDLNGFLITLPAFFL